MEPIVFINGKVKYPITLDPGVWIFDDRKIEIDTYFHAEREETNELEEYTIAASKHWQKEIQEGATMPPTLKTERKFEKQRLMEGTFGIPFEPFLKNAEPKNGVTEVIVTTADKELTFPLEAALQFFLGFSKNGKPLKVAEGGPLEIYFGDATNLDDPIKNVRSFTLR
ncbi:peptidyl-prolyl cis-trans isomerase [Peribacillus sp. SI8-4]|uniref:peptidyl-prolyl cis-trans isomerase n=1 Tax=Peribacillus sp. SI8-4 TaxID=3048009 RepID=UPI002557BC6A|nr:peptidyl-prolyl cis-trans isomerase [Peribacillus sp. SI8-4]